MRQVGTRTCKAPLLLAKSELSRPGDAKDILACAQAGATKVQRAADAEWGKTEKRSREREREREGWMLGYIWRGGFHSCCASFFTPDCTLLRQGRIQQLWSLLSGYQTEMQKQFDVCPDSARSTRRAEKAFRGTMSEPAADAESQSSASASGSPHFPDAKQREDFHQRRRTGLVAIFA